MGEGRSCREPGGRSRGGAGLRGARPRAGAGRGRLHRQTGEGAPAAHAHCGPVAPLPEADLKWALPGRAVGGSSPSDTGPAPQHPEELRWQWVLPCTTHQQPGKMLYLNPTNFPPNSAPSGPRLRGQTAGDQIREGQVPIFKETAISTRKRIFLSK